MQLNLNSVRVSDLEELSVNLEIGVQGLTGVGEILEHYIEGASLLCNSIALSERQVHYGG